MRAPPPGARPCSQALRAVSTDDLHGYRARRPQAIRLRPGRFPATAALAPRELPPLAGGVALTANSPCDQQGRNISLATLALPSRQFRPRRLQIDAHRPEREQGCNIKKEFAGPERRDTYDRPLVEQ